MKASQFKLSAEKREIIFVTYLFCHLSNGSDRILQKKIIIACYIHNHGAPLHLFGSINKKQKKKQNLRVTSSLVISEPHRV